MTEYPRPLVHRLYDSSMSGGEIEARSFEIIDAEAPNHQFTADEWEVVRRMIHTTGDFSIMDSIVFSPDAIDSAVEALRAGHPIYADSNMIRAGLSLARLRTVCANYGPGSVTCHVADEDVAAAARKAGLPRSLFAVRKGISPSGAGIAVFGNAPVGLLELNRLIAEDGARPSLVVGMPVGFVHVIESKDELMSMGVPYIVLRGRRGGSPLAVSVIHALCSIAGRRSSANEERA